MKAEMGGEYCAREWQTTFDAMTDLVAVLDRDRRIVRCNQAMADFLGMTTGEICGRKCNELMHGTCGVPCECPFSKANQSRKRESMLLPLGERMMEVVVDPIFTADRQVSGVVHLVQDITERKRMEEALKREKSFSDAIIASLPGVFGVAATDGTLLRWNENLLKITGYTAEELTGKSAFDFFDSNDRERVAEAIRAALVNGSTEVEADVIFKDGTRVPHHFSGVPAMVGGRACVLAVGTDLSERQRLEADHELLFNASVDMLCKAGFDGYLKRVNPAWTEALGWSQEEMTAKPWLDFVHPEDLEATIEAGARLIGGKCVSLFDNRYRCKDGSYRWMSWSSISLPERREIVAVARDVTERRMAQDQMAQLTERLNLATTAGQIGIWDWDLEHDAVIWDERIHAIFGSGREGFEGTHAAWREAVHPEDREAVEAAVQSALRGETVYDTEYRIVRADGGIRHLRSVGAVHRDESGKAKRMVGGCWDVTKRAQLQESLRRREAWAKGLQEAGEKLAGCHTVHQLAHVAAKVPVDYLGLKISSVGMVQPDGSIRVVAHWPSEREECVRVTQCMRTVLATSDSVLVRDTVAEAPFGESCAGWAERDGVASCAAYPIFAGDKCVAVLSLRDTQCHEDAPLMDARPMLEVFCRQVGEVWRRCLREEQLTESRRAAEAANKAKSAFLASMSHEIRTPMNAILGFSSLLQTAAGLTPEQRKHIDAVQRNGEHLLALINNILEMSSIEAGDCPVKTAALNLGLLIEHLETAYCARAEEKELQFGVTVAGEVPGCVLGDEAKLQTILGNLLENAVQYTDRGRIDLRVRGEALEGERARICFEVEDTGIGISKAECGKIFAVFEQGERGVRHEGSTGLGLAIARNYVHLLGGKIEAKSEPGRGSLFRFAIEVDRVSSDLAVPRHVQPRGAEAGSRSSGRSRAVRLTQEHQGARVLVVEDNSANRTLLVSILQPLGFEIRQAVNGVEALAAFEEFRPAVILMDTRMPEMDGIESARKIKSTVEGARVPIVALSGCSSNQDERRMLEAGASVYLRKPCSPADLLENIRKYAGVDYVYDQAPGKAGMGDAPKLQPVLDVGALPDELVDRLRAAVVACDTEAIAGVSQEAAVFDQESAVVLRELAGELRFDALRAAVDL